MNNVVVSMHKHRLYKEKRQVLHNTVDSHNMLVTRKILFQFIFFSLGVKNTSIDRYDSHADFCVYNENKKQNQKMSWL
jgi:hypothetical protein